MEIIHEARDILREPDEGMSDIKSTPWNPRLGLSSRYATLCWGWVGWDPWVETHG